MCLTCVCSLSVRPQEFELLDPDPNFLEALCGRSGSFLTTSDFRKDTQYEVGQRYRGRDLLRMNPVKRLLAVRLW